MSTFARALRLSLLKSHFPALHGLRVLAILTVVQAHVGFELGARGWLRQDAPVYVISQRIWFGMDLFFFLSGFLIGTILLSPDARGVAGALRFYARRSFRIVPLYYVVLTALALAQPAGTLDTGRLALEYLYLTNYTDATRAVMVWGWSLCVEEHFYLLVPGIIALVLRLRSHRARIAWLAALWLSGFAARCFAAGSLRHGDPAEGFLKLYIPTHTRYDILFAGVLLAYVWHTERPRVVASMSRRGVRLAAVAVCLALFASLMLVPPAALGGYFGLLMIGTVTGAAYLILVTTLITSTGKVACLLGHRAFLYLATLGYGVYLVHMPLVRTLGLDAYLRLAILHRLPQPVAFVLAVTIVFAASLAAGYVLHLLVEKPALFARDRLVPASPRARTPESLLPRAASCPAPEVR